MGVKDIAKKIAAARAAGGGNYFRDGKGVLIVKSITQQNLYKGDTFVAEMEVESSENLADALNADKTPVLANAPGSTVSLVQMFDEHPQTAFSNVKSFLLALLGETDATLTASAVATKAEKVAKGELKATDTWGPDEEFVAAYENVVGASQPCKGMRIRYSTYRKMTKDKSKELVLPRFESMEQTSEQIAEARAKLGG